MGFIIWMIIAVATVIPLLKLLPHFGINKLWALVCLIPLGLLVLLWVMAIKLQELDRR